MIVRHALWVLALPVVSSLAWLGDELPAPAPPGPQERSFGSAVPCAVPLEWRIADVDPRFELDAAAARSAVADAAALWEGAVGRDLFALDSADGLPVRFRFDDRQALLLARRRLERELREAGAGIDARREELAAVRDRLESARTGYGERVAAYERRMEALNAEIRRRNERGGAPDSVRTRLREREGGLRDVRASLERRRRELAELEERLRSETDRLNEGIREYNRRADALGRELPVPATEAGEYGESVTRRDGEVVSVRREIRVFRFDGRDDVVLLLAHELGHALGLGHSGVPGSVMNEVLPREGPIELHSRDVEMLGERCPGLTASDPAHPRAR